MRRNIKLSEEAYERLDLVPTGSRNSVSNVELRGGRKSANTCGKLLHTLEQMGKPPVQIEMIDHYINSRGRRSRRS